MLTGDLFYVIIAPASVFSNIEDQIAVPFTSSGALNFSVDIYQFEDAKDKTRLEICYSIDLMQLEKEKQPRQKGNNDVGRNRNPKNGKR